MPSREVYRTRKTCRCVGVDPHGWPCSTINSVDWIVVLVDLCTHVFFLSAPRAQAAAGTIWAGVVERVVERFVKGVV